MYVKVPAPPMVSIGEPDVIFAKLPVIGLTEVSTVKLEPVAGTKLLTSDTARLPARFTSLLSTAVPYCVGAAPPSWKLSVEPALSTRLLENTSALGAGPGM